ncbi:hypothetical protein HK414_06725 [Ramlibacter terrae]|uniref:Uncharacterized protein n=1 Tax=Ramlibacter terrae TaxID=2732511 RepID=A0ABX6P2R2_9BURK|nr:hypothetical protein HK414_06725 [Ramlibacter terrae]
MPNEIRAGAYCVGDDVKALEIMPTRFKSSNALADGELAKAAFADWTRHSQRRRWPASTASWWRASTSAAAARPSKGRSSRCAAPGSNW